MMGYSMEYGMPTLIEYRSVEEHARFCAANGLDFFEMNLAFPWFQSDRIDPDQMNRLKERYGIGYTLHFHDQLNPFDFSPELRKGAMENVVYGLRLAREIGAAKITMHMIRGTYSAVNGVKTYAYDVCENEYLDNVKAFIEVCDRMLSDMDTLFCIENTNGFMGFQKDAVELMLQSENFGLTFDVGHNYKASEDDESFILSHSDRLQHFHLHDVTAKSNHVALGTGLLDVKKYLKMVNIFKKSAVIEVKESNALVQSLEYIKALGL